MEVVRDEDAGLVPDVVGDALLEDKLADVHVEGAQRVVEEDDVAPVVDPARDVDALLLPAAEGDPALSDLALVAAREDLQVVLEGADVEDLLVQLFVVLLPKDDVVL